MVDKLSIINTVLLASDMQNVYAPLPLVPHIIFCALATLLYAVLFNRRGKKHYLILMIAIDMTLMTQFWTQSAVILTVGISEAVLLLLAGILAFKSSREDKALDEARRAQAEIKRLEREQREQSEKLFVKQEYIDSNFADGASDGEEDE